jgi:hypothetical protein
MKVGKIDDISNSLFSLSFKVKVIKIYFDVFCFIKNYFILDLSCINNTRAFHCDTSKHVHGVR